MRLIFVRHGEPNYEKDCLTGLGRLQASAAGRRLKEDNIDFLCSSPMGRAVETAQLAAEALKMDSIDILPFMHEIYWGDKNGKEMFAGGNPWDIANELMERGEDICTADWENLPMFDQNIVGGYVWDVSVGIDEWLREYGYIRQDGYYICSNPRFADSTIALFCHGGSGTAAICHLLNLPFSQGCALLHMPFTGITILRFDNRPGILSMPSLELACDGRHISGVTL
ncbi:MAG: histidine phosphatase family protein [Clostridia bacterium]|nr:histidine phosphatase family protein [Clostridia bacterium]